MNQGQGKKQVSEWSYLHSDMFFSAGMSSGILVLLLVVVVGVDEDEGELPIVVFVVFAVVLRRKNGDSKFLPSWIFFRT